MKRVPATYYGNAKKKKLLNKVPFINDMIISSGAGSFSIIENTASGNYEIENKIGVRNGVQHLGYTKTTNGTDNQLPITGCKIKSASFIAMHGAFSGTTDQAFGVSEVNKNLQIGIYSGQWYLNYGNSDAVGGTANDLINTYIVSAGYLWVLNGQIDISSFAKISNIIETLTPALDTEGAFTGDGTLDFYLGGVNGASLFAGFDLFAFVKGDYVTGLIESACIFESNNNNYDIDLITENILTWQGIRTNISTNNVNKKLFDGVTPTPAIDTYGYSVDATYGIIPPKLGTDLVYSKTLDAQGNALENVGLVKRNIKIKDSPTYTTNGTNMYGNTGYVTGENSRVDLKFRFPTPPVGTAVVIGQRNAFAVSDFLIYSKSGNFSYRFGNVDVDTLVPITTEIFTMCFDKTGLTINGTLYAMPAYTYGANPHSLYIAALNSAGTPLLYGNIEFFNISIYENEILQDYWMFQEDNEDVNYGKLENYDIAWSGTTASAWTSDDEQYPESLINGYEKYIQDADGVTVIQVPKGLSPTIAGYTFIESIDGGKLNNSGNTYDYSSGVDAPWFNQIDEYANFNGATEHFDTGFLPTNKTRIEIKFKLNSLANSKLFGCRSSSFLFFGVSSGNWYGIANASPGELQTYSEADLDIHCLVFDIVTEKVTLDDEEFGDLPSSVITIINSLFIGAENTGSVATRSACDVFYAKIYEDDVLVRDYVPQADHGLVDLLGFVDGSATPPDYEVYNTLSPTDLTNYEQGDALFNPIYSRVYEDYKYTCNTAGMLSLECEQAYGLIEFKISKGADVNRTNLILSDITNFISDNSYIFSVRNDESLLFARRTSGVSTTLFSTVSSYVENDVEYQIKIVRNETENEYFEGAAGEWLFLIKGGSFGNAYQRIENVTGSNPVIDNTHTSFNYINLDLDASDYVQNIRLSNYNLNPIAYDEISGTFDLYTKYQDRFLIYKGVLTGNEITKVEKYTKPVGDSIGVLFEPLLASDGAIIDSEDEPLYVISD